MDEIDRLRSDLDKALAGLIEGVAGIAQEAFERPRGDTSIRDRMWRAGLVEDWTRRAVDQGLAGREVAIMVDRDRPAIAQTPDYLITWLEQCRRPTLALLRRLSDDALDQQFTLTAGESTRPRALLEALAGRLRDDAEQVRAWRALEEE